MGFFAKSKHFLHKVFFSVTCFFLTIILIFVLVLLGMLFSPIFLFRKSVTFYAKRFRPDLGNIHTTRSTLTSVHDVYTNPKCNVLAETISNVNPENLDLLVIVDTLREQFRSRVLEATMINGELQYPELRQYVYKWMGFMFWRWDKSFDLNNHIKIESKHGPCNRYKIDKIKQSLLIKPWTRGRSPWEFILIPNYSDEDGAQKIIILFIFQHGLGDGFSWMKIINLLAGNTLEVERVQALQRQSRSSGSLNPLRNVLVLLKSPYDLMYSIMKVSDGFPWGISPGDFSSQFIVMSSEKISVKLLKDTRNRHGVQFTSVLLALITAGVRKAFETKGVKATGKSLPKYMSCAAASPMIGHPDKLRNHVTYAVLRLPLAESNSKQRLLICEREFAEAKESSAPLGTFYLQVLNGAMFRWFAKSLTKGLIGGINLSNFPGPPVRFSLADHEIEGLSVCFGILPGVAGIAFCIISYYDSIQISITVDKALMSSDEEVKVIFDGIMEELSSYERDLV